MPFDGDDEPKGTRHVILDLAEATDGTGVVRDTAMHCVSLSALARSLPHPSLGDANRDENQGLSVEVQRQALLRFGANEVPCGDHRPAALKCCHSIFCRGRARRFAQERRACERLTPPHVMCKRGGASEFERVAGTSLVPGDLIHVRIGDKIPADCRVVKVDIDSETGLPCFQVDQSALTGESQFTTKTTVTETPEAVNRRNINPNLSQLNLEASNLVFLGTLCADGGADLLVVKTGSDCMFAILSSLFVR